MFHRFSIGIVFLLLTGPTSALAYNEIPTVSEIQYYLDTFRLRMEGKKQGYRGQIIAGVPLPPENWVVWSLAHRETQLALVSGKLATFRDKLQRLEEMGSPGDPGSIIKLAELYSLAVEVGVTSINSDRLAELLVSLKYWIPKIPVNHGPNLSMDDNERIRIRSNFAYQSRDSIELKNLYEIASGTGNTKEAAFLRGYVALLIAKLEQSEEPAYLVVNQLQPFVDESEEGGTLSLYIGTAYLILASTTKGEERKSHLEQAKLFAKQARQNLELLDIPVMWGLAMSLTADVLAMEQALAEPGSKDEKLLRLKSNRTPNLSTQFH